MKNEKVYIEGYVVGSFADTLGNRGKQIQLINGDIADIDDNFIYKSIEPEKVKIPQFVAVWIETAKKETYNIRGAIEMAPKGTIGDWLELKNVDIFAEAWVNGYEVEKEKRYRISMPKARNYKNHAQILCEKDGKIFWCGEWYPFRTKFTRKELEEAGFGEVFNSPLFEVKEVE